MLLQNKHRTHHPRSARRFPLYQAGGKKLVENQIIDYGLGIEEIALAISVGDLEKARQIAIALPKRIKKKKIANAEYAKSSNLENNKARKYTESDLIKLFIRDRFIDRYTGLRLVIPPSLRVISNIIPEAFPFHPNWAEGKGHDAYWDLSATADHIKPVAENGQDDPDNLVSTSMAINLQKNSISLDALGWKLYSPGTDKKWDGLSRFFVEQCKLHPEWLKNQYFRKWYKAVRETNR